MKKIIYFLAITSFFLGCAPEKEETISEEAQKFLDSYSEQVKDLIYTAEKAAWKSNTMIIEGDSTNSIATRKSQEAYAEFTGSTENIEKAKYFLENKEGLTGLQLKQFETILYAAANNPQTIPDIVKSRIKAETEQTEKLYGFNFIMNGDTLTTNAIDAILDTSNDLAKRAAAWACSKEVGVSLKSGLENLRDLRNKTVQALGYNDYFTYQVSDYGISTKELIEITRQMNKEIWPLYRELHTYARYELAKKFNVEEVPEMLPAHWLPNRWGQDWASMVTVEGLDLESVLKNLTSNWMVEQAERFYISLGFDELPQSFYDRSDLYPLPDGATYKKNNHASAWHLNLQEDVRCLMSVVPNTRWYETTHHELGHIYYYISYTNPEVPLLLRSGANRGFHEAMGSLMGLAAMQKPFLDHLDLLPEEDDIDSAALKDQEIQALLKEALNYIVFIPWGAGVMTEFEYDLYTNELPPDQFNKRWWELKKQYQGIVCEEERGEEFCDAASKTHINNDAAQYYDYAISYVLLFQFHDYIATKILKQDPHATNYYGNKEVGKFLTKIMQPGATKDWRVLLEEITGEKMSANAMLQYFEPLMEFLQKKNEGRLYTLPELN